VGIPSMTQDWRTIFPRENRGVIDKNFAQ